MKDRRAALAELSITPVAIADDNQRTGTRPGRLALDRLYPNPNQPRKHFDPQTILELAADMAANGQLQPLRVRPPGPDGRHQIIMGERRWRALQKIDGVGVAEVVVDYGVADDDAAYEQALAENLQRDDLTRAEVAAALLNRKQRYGLTNEQLAQRCHKSLAWVDQHMRYAQLPAESRDLMDRKGVDLKVAGILQSLGEEAHREVLEAVSTLPDQRTQVDFARTVRDIHASGADLPSAVEAAREIRTAGRQSAGRTIAEVRGSDPAPRQGRPRALTLPFQLEPVQGSDPQVRVHPRALATSALLGIRNVGIRQWAEAVASDITALRDLCARHESGGLDWGVAKEILEAVLAD